jgi:hypothetical protein
LVNEAYFNLADILRTQRWSDAIDYYLKVNADKLARDQWSECLFSWVTAIFQ